MKVPFSMKISEIFKLLLLKEVVKVFFQESPVFSKLYGRDLPVLNQFINR